MIVSFLTIFTISMNVGEIWPCSPPKIFKRYGCHLVQAPQREMKRIIFILESLLKLIKYQVIKKLAQSSWMKKSNFSCDESNLESYMKINGFSCKFMKSSTSGSVNQVRIRNTCKGKTTTTNQWGSDGSLVDLDQWNLKNQILKLTQ